MFTHFLLTILIFICFQVRIHSFLQKTKNQGKKIADDTDENLIKEKELHRKRINSLVKRKKSIEVQKLLKKEDFKPWGRDTQAKVIDFSFLICFFISLVP